MKKYIFNVSCKLFGTLELDLEDNYSDEEAIEAIRNKIDNDSEYQLLQNLEINEIDIYETIDLPHIFDFRENQIPKKGDLFEYKNSIGEILSVDKKNCHIEFKLDGQIGNIHLGTLWNAINQEKGYFTK